MRAWSLLKVRAAFSVLSLFVVSCGGNADVPSAPSPSADAAPIAAVEISELRVTAEATDVVVGATTTVTATASYSDGTTAVVTPVWQSSAEAVATVTAAGVVTGVSAGTTTVTGTFEGTSGSVTVTVSAPVVEETPTVSGLAVAAAATDVVVVSPSATRVTGAVKTSPTCAGARTGQTSANRIRTRSERRGAITRSAYCEAVGDSTGDDTCPRVLSCSGDNGGRHCPKTQPVCMARDLH